MPLPIAGAMLAFRGLPWKLIGLSALALLIAGLFIALKIERVQNDKLKAQIEKCSDAREADRRAYEQAQEAAKLKNQAEVQRIETEQERVTHEVTRDLNSRLERLRRELRQKAPAPGSSPGGPATGPDGKPRPGSPEASRLCLAPDELLRGAENEERHDQLITWIEQQLKITR